MARRKKKTDCVRIACKYRAYPDANQQILFQKTFGCCRKMYNLMLADKIEYYHQTKKMLYNTPAQYKDSYSFLREVDSLALGNVKVNLETAYERFFDKVSKFPKFKSKKTARKSYTTNLVNGNIVSFLFFFVKIRIRNRSCIFHILLYDKDKNVMQKGDMLR